jgi:hypothetical protein
MPCPLTLLVGAHVKVKLGSGLPGDLEPADLLLAAHTAGHSLAAGVANLKVADGQCHLGAVVALWEVQRHMDSTQGGSQGQ